MTQGEFEVLLLIFLKNEGGIVSYGQINLWKKSHSELSRYSIDETLKNLHQQNLIEIKERGVRAL